MEHPDSQQPLEDVQIAGRIRYKKLAYYLSILKDLPLKKFEKTYPNGFLVERFQTVLDSNVIFQFSTWSEDDPEIVKQLEKGVVEPQVLEARVIEIREKKSDTASGIITIGRSADNDIVLYNKMVSKAHCHISVSTDRETCYLIDIGSTNGTLLNNNKIKPYQKYQLSEGDEITFGIETKVFYFSSKAFHEFLSELKSASTYTTS